MMDKHVYSAPNDSTEKSVQHFYETYGWVNQGDDAKRGEDVLFRLAECGYEPYESAADERTIGQFQGLQGSLLIAGGGDMPTSHLRIAGLFDQVTCLDISAMALQVAKEKLKSQGTFIQGSILDIPLDSGTFDAVFSAHVIYHINIKDQEQAIRELLRVLKPGGRLVVFYFNPWSPLRVPVRLRRKLRKIFASKPLDSNNPASPPPLYFKAHPLSWWQRFQDTAAVTLQSGLITGGSEAIDLIWSRQMGVSLYKAALALEQRFPRLAARICQYPLIILDKY